MTIAGSIFGIYVSFGFDATALLTASVMPAPPALGVSKLSYRETKSSIHRKDGRLKVPLSDDINVVEAAFKGAIFGMQLGLNIAAQFVAFLAIIEMLDEFMIASTIFPGTPWQVSPILVVSGFSWAALHRWHLTKASNSECLDSVP